MSPFFDFSVHPAHCSVPEERTQHPTSAIHQTARVLCLSAVRTFLIEFYEPGQNLLNRADSRSKRCCIRQRPHDEVCACALISTGNLIQFGDQ